MNIERWLMGLFGSRRHEGTLQNISDQNKAHRLPADETLQLLAREMAALRETMWALHKLETARAIRHLEKIMTAIDDLKTDVAALIGEAVADINALAQAIAAAGSQDPAIVALSGQIKDATKTIHDSFTAATGTPVPVPTTPPTATDPNTDQPLPAAPPPSGA